MGETARFPPLTPASINLLTPGARRRPSPRLRCTRGRRRRESGRWHGDDAKVRFRGVVVVVDPGLPPVEVRRVGDVEDQQRLHGRLAGSEGERLRVVGSLLRLS